MLCARCLHWSARIRKNVGSKVAFRIKYSLLPGDSWIKMIPGVCSLEH